jgi:toxin CptA
MTRYTRTIPGITLSPPLSRQLGAFLALIHLLVFVALIAAQLPLPIRLCLLGMLALHAIHSYLQLIGAYAGSIFQAHIEADGCARLFLRDGREIEACLQPDTLVTPWLLILRFSLKHSLRKKNLVIGHDALSAEELRRLRVLLRFVRADQTVDQ